MATNYSWKVQLMSEIKPKYMLVLVLSVLLALAGVGVHAQSPILGHLTCGQPAEPGWGVLAAARAQDAYIRAVADGAGFVLLLF